jgi:hypothetical protein
LPCHNRLSLAPPPFCTLGYVDPRSSRCYSIFLDQQDIP